MEVAILGGGIAGLSTAIALTLAGYKVDIYERHAAMSTIGAGIVCWPNACFVLNELGVLNKLMLVSNSLNKMNRFSHVGEALGSIDINKLSEIMGYASYSIIRENLMTLLIERASELNINIHYSHAAIAISDEDKEGVRVQFENGKSIQPDMILGADGRMNSITRTYVNGDNTPIYQGFINWIGVVESHNELFKDMSVSDYWGTGDRFGIVPVSSKKAYWAGGTVSENISTKNPDLYKQELHAIFSHWVDPIASIIDKTPLSDINKIYVHDHNPIKKWHKNNVLLLGDAAHAALPTSGQGACQALEDAWHFTNILNENKDNISLVFELFTQLRMEKTTGITRGGRQLASALFNNDANVCIQRNVASKNTDYQELVNGMATGWASGLPIDLQVK